MTGQFTIEKIAASVFEVVLSLWFFRSELRREESSWRKWLSALPLLGLVPLVLSADFVGSMAARFFYRWGLVFAALLILKRKDVPRCLYMGALCALTAVTQQNLLILSKALTRGLISDPALRTATVLLLEYIIPFLIFTWISQTIDFSRVKAFTGHQIVMLALLIPSVLYVKSNFFLSPRNTPMSLTVSSAAYPVIISLLAMVIIANYDRFWQLRVDREEQILLDMARQYQYKNLQDSISAQEENRAIIHDIRNHLLALSAADGQTHREHIDSLLESIDTANITADTGNETLDAILLQKQREAISQHIRMVADLDLREAVEIGPMETISIFANALDNALEAASQVPAEEDRYIHLRGAQAANLYVVCIANSCVDGVKQGEDGLLLTKKADAEHHGVGLRSMRRALQKVGGCFSFEQKDGCFALSISLPLRQE